MASLIIIRTSQLPRHIAAAQRVAVACNTTVLEEEVTPEDNQPVLAFMNDAVELRCFNERPGKGVRIDLDAFADDPTRKLNRSAQPLSRALGKGARAVTDATAGLGQDATQLAVMGYNVHAVERSPVMHALLEDALERSNLRNAFTLECNDARTALADTTPDVVYIDPMFPPKRKKSALPRKSIRAVGAVVGPDLDAHELLAAARAVAQKRVVVKRPTWADPLADDAVAEHGGKLVRYDVFLP